MNCFKESQKRSSCRASCKFVQNWNSTITVSLLALAKFYWRWDGSFTIASFLTRETLESVNESKRTHLTGCTTWTITRTCFALATSRMLSAWRDVPVLCTEHLWISRTYQCKSSRNQNIQGTTRMWTYNRDNNESQTTRSWLCTSFDVSTAS